MAFFGQRWSSRTVLPQVPTLCEGRVLPWLRVPLLPRNDAPPRSQDAEVGSRAAPWPVAARPFTGYLESACVAYPGETRTGRTHLRGARSGAARCPKGPKPGSHGSHGSRRAPSDGPGTSSSSVVSKSLIDEFRFVDNFHFVAMPSCEQRSTAGPPGTNDTGSPSMNFPAHQILIGRLSTR